MYSPQYTTNKKPLAPQFSKFLKDARNQMIMRETDDKEIGLKYITDNADKINLDYLLTHATPKMETLLEIALDENMTPKEIIDILVDTAFDVESVGVGTSHNSLLRVPIEEFVIDLNEIAGKIDNVPFQSIFKGFLSKLTDEEAQKALEQSYAEDDGKMYLEAPNHHWELTADEDEFKKALIEKLGVIEKEFEEEHPAVARLSK